MSKGQGKDADSKKTKTVEKFAEDISKFQARRQHALKQMESLMEEIDEIDSELSEYLADIPVLL